MPTLWLTTSWLSEEGNVMIDAAIVASLCKKMLSSLLCLWGGLSSLVPLLLKTYFQICTSQ